MTAEPPRCADERITVRREKSPSIRRPRWEVRYQAVAVDGTPCGPGYSSHDRWDQAVAAAFEVQQWRCYCIAYPRPRWSAVEQVSS